MKLHSEKIIHHKSFPEVTVPSQSDDDYQASKNDDWSSSDEQFGWEKGKKSDNAPPLNAGGRGGHTRKK